MQLYNYTKAGSSNVIDPTFPDRVESDSCLNGASHVETRLATLIEEYLHTASTLNIIGKEIEALLEQKEAQAKQKEQRCKEIWLRAQKERMEMKSESTSTRSRMEKALHSTLYGSGATLESQKGKYPPANRNFPSKFRIPSNNSLALFHDNLAEDERVKSSNRAGTSNRLRARHVMDDERSTSIDTETTLSADESTGVMNEEDLRKLEEEEQIAIMEAIKEEEEEAWATADEPARVEGECIEAWAREVDWRWEMADELARIENQDIEAWVNGVKLGRTIQGTSQAGVFSLPLPST
ncbi:hypothetical protein CPB86DRAFT_185481 [Serendipita vermifera]|nr:hypothetical protein CPB86DRAFT_185481 [Serendipita vermifera]